jgi:hypothetical protein
MALVPKLVRLYKDPRVDLEHIQDKAMMHSAGITRDRSTGSERLIEQRRRSEY